MIKNLMPNVAELLGVELGEVFEVTNGKHTSKAIIINNTFCEVTKEGLCNPNSLLLQVVLKGEFSVQKLPFEPKNGYKYFYPCPYLKQVMQETWGSHTLDFALKKLGMIYRTYDEAKMHFAEDYKELTGKNFEV